MLDGSSSSPMTWDEFKEFSSKYAKSVDVVNGANNAHSLLRLHGKPESSVRLTFYRDSHAWCPYCQKVWFWLEEKEIPYRVKKVTMSCVGEKEKWYLALLPRGQVPAIQFDGSSIVTESSSILTLLEREYGPLSSPISSVPCRKVSGLERELFRAWCRWLCYPTRSYAAEKRNKKIVSKLLTRCSSLLGDYYGPFFLKEFSSADVIMVPIMERMCASLAYYKGFLIKSEFPKIRAWFKALEERPAYRGLQSSYHTHAHSLPPQMGSCFSNFTPKALARAHEINRAQFKADSESESPSNLIEEVVYRVCRHWRSICRINPCDTGAINHALRCTLSNMINDDVSKVPPKGTAAGLRFIRDRVCSPRDMSLHACRLFQSWLERTAALEGTGEPEPVSLLHRKESDPKLFTKLRATRPKASSGDDRSGALAAMLS